MREERIQGIMNYLDNFYSRNDIVKMWNMYCEQNDSMEEYIYENTNEFFNEHFPYPSDAVRAVFFGKYEWEDMYVYINTYGNVVSFSNEYESKSPIDMDSLVEWLISENGLLYFSSGDLHNEFYDYFTSINSDDYYFNTIVLSLIKNNCNLITEKWEDVANKVLLDIKSNEEED